jgi:hypothetical protein
MRLVQNYTEIIINSPKLYSKGTGLLYIISISEILVYFRKENGTKLNKSMAFIKLGDELIIKGEIILQFPDTRYLSLLDIYNTAALLGKYIWNILEIFRRLAPLGLVYYGVYILPYSLLYSSFPFFSFESSL